MTVTVAPRAKSHVLPLLLRPRAIIRFVLDGRAPKLPKLVLLAAALYAVIPVDLIPDLMPFVGWLDDMGILAAAMAWLLSAVAKYEDARAAAPAEPGL